MASGNRLGNESQFCQLFRDFSGRVLIFWSFLGAFCVEQHRIVLLTPQLRLDRTSMTIDEKCLQTGIKDGSVRTSRRRPLGGWLSWEFPMSRSEKFRNGQETVNSPASEHRSHNSTITRRMHTALRSERTHVTTLPNSRSTFQRRLPPSSRKRRSEFCLFRSLD